MSDRKRNGAANGARKNGKGTRVTRANFVKDPARYVDEAIDHGPVTITDAKGKPRAMIVVPKPVVVAS
jgi:hypothetical protein